MHNLRKIALCSMLMLLTVLLPLSACSGDDKRQGNAPPTLAAVCLDGKWGLIAIELG